VRGTSVPAAYEAFLQGWEHYRRTTPDDYARAIPHLEDAIKLDPNYGRAYAALAMVYFSTYDRWWHESLGITYAEAKRRTQQFLDEAKTNPTSTSHQVAGNMLRSAGRSEQALDEFRAAIALDPSDSWNYAFLAETLNLAGRSLEAIPSIEKAMRLDPHYPADFLRILGMAQFQLEQFADAADSLSRASAMNPDDLWSLAGLVATDGYLGRKNEAATAIAHYNAAAAKLGFLPLSIWGNWNAGGSSSFPISSDWEMLPIPISVRADQHRLAEGLQLAGVPLFETEDAVGSKNKLTTAELHSLVVGHELRGHEYGYSIDADRFASITADGIANFSGDWGSWKEVAIRIEGGQLCLRAQFYPACFDVYRYPGGTKAKLNEYITLRHPNGGVFTFSQVK
jgi:Tfp pilus assembly protein PilF